jgi:hypothetical protein
MFNLQKLEAYVFGPGFKGNRTGFFQGKLSNVTACSRFDCAQ